MRRRSARIDSTKVAQWPLGKKRLALGVPYIHPNDSSDSDASDFSDASDASDASDDSDDSDYIARVSFREMETSLKNEAMVPQRRGGAVINNPRRGKGAVARLTRGKEGKSASRVGCPKSASGRRKKRDTKVRPTRDVDEVVAAKKTPSCSSRVAPREETRTCSALGSSSKSKKSCSEQVKSSHTPARPCASATKEATRPAQSLAPSSSAPSSSALSCSAPSSSAPCSSAPSYTPLSPPLHATSPARTDPNLPAFIPLPKFANTVQEREAALALVPETLPGFGACIPKPVSPTFMRVTRSEAAKAKAPKGRGKWKGKGKSAKRPRIKKDPGLVEEEPVLVDLVGYQPANKVSVFAGALYNGVTYRIGDHVVLHTDDVDGPQWIVVCEGFYASADCVPMFHGRWYYTRQDVLHHGGRTNLKKLSAYERFSTDARDQNLVESIVGRVYVLPKNEFYKLYAISPDLVKGLYFCSNFYATQTGDMLAIPDEALPTDCGPQNLQRRVEAMKKSLSAKGWRAPPVPLRVSKRSASRHLPTYLCRRPVSDGACLGSVDNSSSFLEDAVTERAAKRLRSR